VKQGIEENFTDSAKAKIRLSCKERGKSGDPYGLQCLNLSDAVILRPLRLYKASTRSNSLIDKFVFSQFVARIFFS
jgi:hypothetical protein